MEWIKITEKKPNEDEWIIATDGEDIHMVSWNELEGYVLPGLYFKKDITHWMYLPELPEDD